MCFSETPSSFLRSHDFSPRRIQPDPAKTEVVKSYPPPVDATGVRRFLGLASYYRRFVPNFASIAAPLQALTKKNAVFQWSEKCEEAFVKLKRLLTTTPVLAYPKFGPGCSFILEMDASTVGLGAVLSQTQDDGTVHTLLAQSTNTTVFRNWRRLDLFGPSAIFDLIY